MASPAALWLSRRRNPPLDLCTECNQPLRVEGLFDPDPALADKDKDRHCPECQEWQSEYANVYRNRDTVRQIRVRSKYEVRGARLPVALITEETNTCA